MNILYLHSHDTGRFVQPYEHPINTPRLRALANDGVLFQQAFCAAPTCSASRAGLLTGQCAHQSGMLGLAHRGFSLRDERQHLANVLKDAGYHTALFGTQHVGPDPFRLGYLEATPGIRPADQIASEAARFLAHQGPQPFFLDVGFFETHRRGELPDGRFFSGDTAADGSTFRPPTPLPSEPAVRQDLADFAASAAALDRGIGIVLDALDRSGKAGDTLVICTTDHGIPFPEHKCTLYDRGIGVMLILRGPPPLSGGRGCGALVSQCDLFPTVMDLINRPRPTWLEGRSLLPVLRGERDEIHDAVFAEVNYHAAYEPMRAVRTLRWKYIRRFDGRDRRVLPNCDDSPSKTAWIDNTSAHPLAEEQLFDLASDPDERVNLVDNSRVRPVLEEMRERLGGWMKQTNDPLLAGAIAAPSGARINHPDGLSPNEPLIQCG